MNKLLLSSFIFTLLSIGSCAPEGQAQAPFQNLNSTDFQTMMGNDDVVVLDVRTPGEAARGIIDNAVLIDISRPDFMQKVSQLDKSKTYLVYCRSGNRSVTACNAMSNQGFKKLYNLQRGILDWQRNQLPLSKYSN